MRAIFLKFILDYFSVVFFLQAASGSLRRAGGHSADWRWEIFVERSDHWAVKRARTRQCQGHYRRGIRPGKNLHIQWSEFYGVRLLFIYDYVFVCVLILFFYFFIIYFFIVCSFFYFDNEDILRVFSLLHYRQEPAFYRNILRVQKMVTYSQAQGSLRLHGTGSHWESGLPRRPSGSVLLHDFPVYFWPAQGHPLSHPLRHWSSSYDAVIHDVLWWHFLVHIINVIVIFETKLLI